MTDLTWLIIVGLVVVAMVLHTVFFR